MSRDKVAYLPSWDFEFELDFQVGFSSWIFELGFRVGFSSWIFELDFIFAVFYWRGFD